MLFVEHCGDIALAIPGGVGSGAGGRDNGADSRVIIDYLISAFFWSVTVLSATAAVLAAFTDGIIAIGDNDEEAPNFPEPDQSPAIHSIFTWDK